MNPSILNSIKKVLGLPADHTEFDEDVLMHINSVFSTLHQLGVGPPLGFMIEDEDATWDTFLDGDKRQNQVKSYVYLRVRMLFDPPQTSYLQTAMLKQIEELEWRINIERESVSWVPATPEVIPPETIIDGGWA